MDFSQINIFAIFVAAVSSFFLGGFWYSKLGFGKLWIKETGINEDAENSFSMVKIFSFAFIANLISRP